MIRFSNGYELTFACGSGALAFDGRGWWWEYPLRWARLLDPKAFTVVAKTVTLHPKKGNLSMWHPWTCVRHLSDKPYNQLGAVNAIGLTNPGIEHWVKYDYPMSQKMGYQIAASVKPDDGVQARCMAVELKPLHLAYIEVNLSCPNVHDIPRDIPEILDAFQRTGHPVVLKLSEDQVEEGFIKAVDPYVEAYHAINTIPWKQVFHDKTSPIEKYPHKLQGGVSGSFIHRRALNCVNSMTGLTDKPTIGGGGIFQLQDVYNFQNNGAKAFSIGTCFMLRPWRPNRIVREYLAKPTV